MRVTSRLDANVRAAMLLPRGKHQSMFLVQDKGSAIAAAVHPWSNALGTDKISILKDEPQTALRYTDGRSQSFDQACSDQTKT